MTDIERKMKRNIKLFGVYKIFTKRLFLPLTTIYASQVAGLQINQIGIITAVAVMVSILFETSSGYWADEHGRANSSRIGAALAALGTLLYIVAPSFWGIMLAATVLAIGYSFLSGSMEALIHDSLVVLKEEENYAKIASRAQSLSLVANAAFIGLVPLLYPIDKRLPFAAGVIAYIILFILASLLTEPLIKHTENRVTIMEVIRKLINKHTIALFLCIGFAYALISGLVDTLNLTIFHLGLKPQYTGIMYAAASLVGALVGLYIHYLKKLSFAQFAVFDAASNLLVFLCYGVFRSLPLAIAAFIINMSLWRYQKIMYQHYILQIYGHTRYKATLLSLFSNFGLMHEAWLGIMFTHIAVQKGLFKAINFAIPIQLLFIVLFVFAIRQFTAYSSASRGSVNH